MHTNRCLALLGLLALACGPKTSAEDPGQLSPTEGPEAVAQAAGKEAPEPPDLLPEPLANDPMGVTIHRLENGLTVYISSDPSTPSISSWIAVRAGSRHDPATSTGLAHYLEHMLFKGTGKLGSLDFAKEKPHLDRIAALYAELHSADEDKRRGILAQIDKETLASSQHSVPNEFDNLYAALGISGVNAFTGNEQTVYVANVPSNRFETWAQVEGERFSDPQFRLFYPELESVYEELNRSLDNPQSRMFHALFKGLFPEHPYGTQPTIGLPEHLKLPAYGDMVEYFDTWYRPNNMAIVLAGDIDAERALPVLERAFGGMEPKELPTLPAAPIEPPAERTEIEIVAPGEQGLLLSWPTVPAGHPDEIALQAMDMVVDNSATGLLNIELVLSQQLPRAGSFPEHLTEGGAWTLSATARDGQSLEEVESLLMGVVAKLKKGAFTQNDLDAIVINTEISKKRQLESNQARVSQMASAFVESRPWPEVVAWQDKLRAVTREDVVRVANTYLSDAPVVVKRVRGEFKAPKVEKPSISPITIDSSKASVYATTVKATSVEPLEPEWLVEGEHYQRSRLPAGDFIAVKNPRNDLFAIDYEFKLGERQEPLLCFGLELLETSGAGDRSAAELQKALYSIGSSVSFACNSRGSSISVTGIDRKMEESLTLLNEWLTAPRVVAGSLDKLRANVLSKRNDMMNEPSVISQALAEFAFFGKESSFLQVPSNKKLTSAKLADVLGVTQALPNLEHRTSYMGPRSAEQVKELVGLGTAHKAPKKDKPVRYSRVRKPTLFFIDQKVAQAQIRIGFPASPLPVSDLTKANLFNQYVGGGMGGLVFQEIREARGLAYSAWTYYLANQRTKDETAVVAGLGTQADKTTEAVITLLGLIRPLTIEPARFEVARASLIADTRKQRLDPRQRAEAVFRWADLGLKEDPRPAQFADLKKLEAKAVQSFANARTRVSPILAISGDSSRIALTALAKAVGVGKTQMVEVSQLFGF